MEYRITDSKIFKHNEIFNIKIYIGLLLFSFVDPNWAQDANDLKSQYGFCVILAGAAITWESNEQKVIETSSAEAEYAALSEAAKDCGFHISCFSNIHCDPQSAQHSFHHSRTKH